MSVLPHEEMTRDDLIATLGATESKLKATRDRVGVLEARVKELVELRRQDVVRSDHGHDNIHDD